MLVLQSPWVSALVGGLMIGAAAAFLMLVNGRPLDIAETLRALTCRPIDPRWRNRLALLVGVLLGPRLLSWLGVAGESGASDATGVLALAGFCLGLGAHLAAGCTIWHGLAGMTRPSPRSWFAVVSIFLTAVLTLSAIRQFLGRI
ncbi:MAG: YeeE/YedE family protein [Burkholderiaceae bacterium]